MYITTSPSPEVENFQMKIYYPAKDRTLDLLNQRQTCYHMSQRGELFGIMVSASDYHPRDPRFDSRDLYKVVRCANRYTKQVLCYD